MHPTPRSSFSASLFATATTPLFLVILFPVNAQKPAGPPSNVPAQAQNPSPKKITVITGENLDDTILKQERPSDAPLPEPVSAGRPAAPVTSEQTARTGAEIASLEKQIKEKQKRIELLMRLFVTDEKKFVQFSGALETDPEVQTRIHQEQEELRRETAACAQLQTRLDALRDSTSAPH